VVGNRTKIKVVKNKLAPPFREVEFDVLYNEGISKLGDMIDVAIENDIIQKSGSWFSFSGERIGQGRDAVKAFLKDDAASYAKVERLVREKLGISIDPTPLPINGHANGHESVAAGGTLDEKPKRSKAVPA